MDKHTTDKLNETLINIDRADKLQEYVDNLGEEHSFESFHDYFNSLPQVISLDKAELIRRTNIERSYGYQILKGTRSPGRDKAILLCIGAVLSLHETQRALRSAGEPVLYPRNRRDAILIFALNERLDISDTQELLQQFHEPVLE